MIVNSARLQAR